MLPLLLLLAGHCAAAAARGGQFGHGLRTQNRVIRHKNISLFAKNIFNCFKIFLVSVCRT